MHWHAVLLTVLLAVVLIAATAYVFAGDLVNEVLDDADPIAGFAEELAADVELALARTVEAGWQDRPHFARWEQELRT